jgi:hypothetical protein
MSAPLRSPAPYVGEQRRPVVPVPVRSTHPHRAQNSQRQHVHDPVRDGAASHSGPFFEQQHARPCPHPVFNETFGLVRPTALQNAQFIEIHCSATSNSLQTQDDMLPEFQSLDPTAVKVLCVKNFWRQSEGVSFLGFQMANLRFLQHLDVEVQSYPLIDSLAALSTLVQITARFERTHAPSWLPQSIEVKKCQAVWRDVMLHLTTPILDLHIDHYEPWHEAVLVSILRSANPVIQSLHLNTNQNDIRWTNGLRYGLCVLPSLKNVQFLGLMHPDPSRFIWSIAAFTEACFNIGSWTQLNQLFLQHMKLTEAHLDVLAPAVGKTKNLQMLSIVLAFSDYTPQRNAQIMQTFLTTCMGAHTHKPFHLTVYVDASVRMNEAIYVAPPFIQLALPSLQLTIARHIAAMKWPNVTCALIPIESPSLASHHPEFAHVS